ncbi:Tuberous sclerosis 2-like protein [Rhizoclosmatium sp. JEL0117]|nr:Tuberous sclerosis 2-like protein [Rhizoclosmatium sp. JEL0117]
MHRLLSHPSSPLFPPSLKASFALELSRVSLKEEGESALVPPTLSTFVLLTNAATSLELFDSNTVSRLFKRWFDDARTLGHAMNQVRNVVKDPSFASDSLAQSVAEALFGHLVAAASPAFTLLSLKCLKDAIEPLILSLQPLTATKTIAVIAFYLSLDNIPSESRDSALASAQLLLCSKSIKIARTALLDVCSFATGEKRLSSIFASVKEPPSILFQIGALRLLAAFCFQASPTLEEFASSYSIRHAILSCFLSTSTPIPDVDQELLHQTLLSLLHSWILQTPTSITSQDWDLILKVLTNLKDYIFQFSLQSTQKFEIGSSTSSTTTKSTLQQQPQQQQTIEQTYTQICTLLHTYYPSLPTSSPDSMYTLFLTLLSLARNTIILSEPLTLATIDYACSTSESALSPETAASNLSRLVYVFFKSKANFCGVAQVRVLERVVEGVLAGGSGLGGGGGGGGGGAVDGNVLKEVVEYVVENSAGFEAVVLEKVLGVEVLEVVAEEVEDVGAIVLGLKNVVCGSGGGVGSVLGSGAAVKALVILFWARRKQSGEEAIVEALLEVVGESKVDVSVRVRCVEFLMGLTVEGRVGRVGGFWSGPFTEWVLGTPKDFKLRGSLLVKQEGGQSGIDLDALLATYLRILKFDGQWEVYYLMLQKFEGFLRSIAMASPQLVTPASVELIRAHFCELVVSETIAVSVTNLPSTVKKSDLYLLVFKVLMTLLLWDDQFDKPITDQVLKCFQLGLTRWPTTSKYCMNSFTHLLTHLPAPMTRLVPTLLQTISRITSAGMQPSILEFLSTLARLPLLSVNLREEDYKRVFGIALQSIRNSTGTVVDAYAGVLGFHCLSVWFVNLGMGSRSKYVPFILGSLGGGGGSVGAVDESVELVMDMLALNSYVDCAAKADVGEANGAVEKFWVQGNSVVSVRDVGGVGWMEVCVRRPSGCVVFSVKLENALRCRLDEMVGIGEHVGISAIAEKMVADAKEGDIFSFDAGAELGQPDSEVQASRTSLSRPTAKALQSASSIKSMLQLTEPKVALFDPSFFLLQLTPYPLQSSTSPSIPLPTTEEAFTRAIKVLDRTPVSDLHKIGVLYVGPNQTHELQILANDSGSPSYTRFLFSLGELVRLKGLRKYNTGGLDISESGIDGKNCVVWQDDASGNQIVFHATTLMPTNTATDPQCSLKKRHVGNDFVSILYDESGTRKIGFDTLPGQFNFVNIIVTPIVTGDGVAQLEYEERKFRVEMRVKAELGLPALGVFSDGFLVDGAQLAGAVRRAAVHANMLSIVVAQTRAGGGGFISNARERLRQIKRLADRAKKSAAPVANDLEGTLDFTRYA